MELQPVHEGNWQACAAVRPAQDQQDLVAPVAWYLCLCKYERTWQPLAVCVDRQVVGHVMWGVDPTDDSRWIGGLVIDADWQGRGLGRATVEALVRSFRKAGAVEAALSCAPQNARARGLYASLGFRETSERVDGELVARLSLQSAPRRDVPDSRTPAERPARAGAQAAQARKP